MTYHIIESLALDHQEKCILHSATSQLSPLSVFRVRNTMKPEELGSKLANDSRNGRIIIDSCKTL